MDGDIEMTQLKIGDQVAIDQARYWEQGIFWKIHEVIGETATLWQLSDGVYVTKECLKELGYREKYATPVTPALMQEIADQEKRREIAMLRKKIGELIGTASTIDLLTAIYDAVIAVLAEPLGGVEK